MVGVLVRLKLRVLRNSLRGKQVVALIFGGLFGLVFGGLTAIAPLPEFPTAAARIDVLCALYLGWLVGWVLAPIATGGGDETLRPEHFALLPIRPRTLAVGLLGASFVGVPALVSLIAFAGVTVFGLRLGVGPALLGVLGTVLGLVLVVLVYRVVMAALGSLLTSRKGKELGFVLVALAGLSGVGVNYALNSLGPAIVDGRASGFATVARIVPTGWPVLAVAAAGEGRWGQALGLMAALLVLVGLLVLAWGALLARRTNGGGYRGGVSNRAAAKPAGGRTVFGDSPTGAVAAKEVRTWLRDARRRIALLSTVILALVVVILPSIYGGSGSGVTPFIGVVVVVAACMQAGNLYGFDGSAFWHTLVVPDAIRADVRGRQLAWVVLVAPLALLLAAVMPAVAGRPQLYPWVFALVPCVLGTGAGVLLLQSVFAAYAMPDPRKTSSPFASNGRPGCAKILLSFALLALLVAGALPVLALEFAGTLAGLPLLNWLGVPVGLVVGPALAWWWGRIGADRLTARGPELLLTVSKER